MTNYQETELWRGTLAAQPGEEGTQRACRERLRQAYLRFRDHAQALAKRIAQDHPIFTDHSIDHSDALWELTSLVIGTKAKLTPVEAFVLGGAFLIHDLGMTLAAYEDPQKDLHALPEWDYVVVDLVRKRLGYIPPSKDEINQYLDSAMQQEAIAYLLRSHHAEQAPKLVKRSWKHPDNGQVYYLIEDSELRNAYGHLIGQIAFSHWWSIEEVGYTFQEKRGARSVFPKEWTIDPIWLACLLRIVDICHIDASRAPAFSRLLVKLPPSSELHWQSHAKLDKPYIQRGRLVYTSADPFPPEQAEAWWHCFDVLRGVDSEIRLVNTLLTSTNRPELAVHGVEAIESPLLLSKNIGVEGWYPVDTQLRVTNMPHLVKTIGGKELYGDDMIVPLRELIQNAADAVRARRLIDKKGVEWGDVCVRLNENSNSDTEKYWIEVQDNGIGMSPAVLTGPLLDFSTSYWGSKLMREEHMEHTDALATFEPDGRYGIGFFSVFMWGDHVKITTRRYDKGVDETWVLEFHHGVDIRPILRKAEGSERLKEGGTCVQVWLKKASQDQIFIDIKSLKALCRYICPVIDINIYAKDIGDKQEIRVIDASDWITLKENMLFERLHIAGSNRGFPLLDFKDCSGKVIGRLGFTVRDISDKQENGCVITSKGMRIMKIKRSWLIGVIANANVNKVERNNGYFTLNKHSAKEWAENQVKSISIKASSMNQRELAELAALINVLEADLAGEIPIAFISDVNNRGENKWVSVDGICKWSDNHSEILILPYLAEHGTTYEFRDKNRVYVHEEDSIITLNDNVIVVDINYYGLNNIFSKADVFGEEKRYSLIDQVINAIAKSWSFDFPSIEGKDLIRSGKVSRKIGVNNRKRPCNKLVYVIRRISREISSC